LDNNLIPWVFLWFAQHERATLVKDTVKNLDLAAIVFLLFGTVAGIAAIYYLFGIVREWVRRRHRTGKDTIRGTDVAESILDGHIAAQWTEGRLRLDSILTLIKTLAATLGKEVETRAVRSSS
jgi:hypothetical protein